MFVSFQDVSFSYEPSSPVVINSFSARFGQGAVVELRGANGSGKSTLGRLLCGLVAPNSGHVFVGTDEPSRMTARRRVRSAAFVPQRTAEYFLAANLGGDLRHALSFRPGQRSAIEPVIDRFNLAPASTLPADLAVPMAWRLALACGVLIEPNVLFIDEIPSLSSRQTFALLSSIVHERTSRGQWTFLTSHRPSAISQLATDLIEL